MMLLDAIITEAIQAIPDSVIIDTTTDERQKLNQGRIKSQIGI